MEKTVLLHTNLSVEALMYCLFLFLQRYQLHADEGHKKCSAPEIELSVGTVHVCRLGISSHLCDERANDIGEPVPPPAS